MHAYVKPLQLSFSIGFSHLSYTVSSLHPLGSPFNCVRALFDSFLFSSRNWRGQLFPPVPPQLFLICQFDFQRLSRNHPSQNCAAPASPFNLDEERERERERDLVQRNFAIRRNHGTRTAYIAPSPRTPLVFSCPSPPTSCQYSMDSTYATLTPCDMHNN